MAAFALTPPMGDQGILLYVIIGAVAVIAAAALFIMRRK